MTKVRATIVVVLWTSACGSSSTPDDASVPIDARSEPSPSADVMIGEASTDAGSSVDVVDAEPPVDAGPIACSGFTATHMLTIDWDSPQTVTTPAGPDDAIVVTFTTGAATAPGVYGNITGAEYATQPSLRIASLSQAPCDFASSLGAGASSSSNTVTVAFSVGANTSGFYPALAPSTTYYFNVKEPQSSTCVSAGICDMYFQLHKPPGL